MPEVADWFNIDDQPTVIYRRRAPDPWPAEIARYALAGGVIIGVLIILIALTVAAAILVAGLAHWVLAATWGVPAVFTGLCLVPWRR